MRIFSPSSTVIENDFEKDFEQDFDKDYFSSTLSVELQAVMNCIDETPQFPSDCVISASMKLHTSYQTHQTRQARQLHS